MTAVAGPGGPGAHPVKLDDLVLRMRLQTMRRTLLKVQEVRKAVSEARDDIQRLEEKLALNAEKSILRNARIASESLILAQSRLEDTNLGDDGQILEWVKTAKSATDELKKAGNEANDIIRCLKQRWVEIDDDRIGPTIESCLVVDAKKCMVALELVTASLERATDQAAVAIVWKNFEEKVRAVSNPLFDEYVDLLGGLALRTVPVGDLVCQRADVLLKLLLQRSSNPRWGSLSIPAHAESLRMSPAQIIRLGFPGWTIWELPLAAHEFGFAVAALDGINKEINDQRWEAYGTGVLTSLFTDGFAAYTLGPAYACAVLLLRLNPVGASRRLVAGEPSDAERAHMVLGTLRSLDSLESPIAGNGSASPASPPATTYGLVVTELETQWQAALDQVGEPRLSPAEGDVIDTWQTKVVNELLRFETPNGEYTAKHWEGRISNWVSMVLEGDVPRDTVTADVRDVLNVAWQCRLQTDGPTDDLEKTIDQLWDAVVGLTPGSTGTQQPQPGPSAGKGR